MKGELVLYIFNSRTKVIHTNDCGIGKRSSFRNKKINIQEAVDSGYRFCEKCSPVRWEFEKDKKWIQEFCKGKKIMYEYKDGYLIVSTPYGYWRIVPSAKYGLMDLWHQNNVRFHSLAVFNFYHFQKFQRNDLRSFFEYIYTHDLYRAECPARVRKPEFTNEIKGTKRYKKKVEKISKHERYRSKCNNISNVFFLLDQLEAQKCVK